MIGTSQGSFHQHYGKDNIVRNNLFVDAGVASLWRKRAEKHHSFTIAENVIVVPPDGSAFRNTWTDTQFTLRANTYLFTDKRPVFPNNQTLEQWQSTGRDEGSTVENISVEVATDPAALLRRYQRTLGNIDLGAVGPRK